jgi:CRP-like cAMP-binding protein
MGRTNSLIEALPAQDRARLLTLVETATFEKGTTLYDIDQPVSWTVFPVSGLISLVSMTRDGQTLGLAMVGAEGMVATETILQVPAARSRAVTQLSCEVLRIRADHLRLEFERTTALRRVLLQYTSRVLDQAAQAAVCHRFHTLVQRLARWLLAARDCVQSDVIHLTQEGIAGLLGSRRTAVTTASVMLQDFGAIRQRHGRTFIVDAARLRQAACECYAAPYAPTRVSAPRTSGRCVPATQTKASLR